MLCVWRRLKQVRCQVTSLSVCFFAFLLFFSFFDAPTMNVLFDDGDGASPAPPRSGVEEWVAAFDSATTQEAASLHLLSASATRQLRAAVVLPEPSQAIHEIVANALDAGQHTLDSGTCRRISKIGTTHFASLFAALHRRTARRYDRQLRATGLHRQRRWVRHVAGRPTHDRAETRHIQMVSGDSKQDAKRFRTMLTLVCFACALQRGHC
jgi:hypothetical protein